MSAPKRPGAPRTSARAVAPRAEAPRTPAKATPSRKPTRASGRTKRTPPQPVRQPARGESRPGAKRAQGPKSGQVRTATRPGGPSGPGRAAPAVKPRIEAAPAKGSFAAMLSWRTAVIVCVIIVALAVMLPSLRAYFAQQDELQDLRAEVQGARDEVGDLEADVARWDDPAFVVAQARERLAYVFPGETPYRVIDPEFVRTHAEGSPAASKLPGADEADPWFDVMWDSILVAGNGPPVAEEEVAEVIEPEDDAPLTDVDFGG